MCSGKFLHEKLLSHHLPGSMATWQLIIRHASSTYLGLQSQPFVKRMKAISDSLMPLSERVGRRMQRTEQVRRMVAGDESIPVYSGGMQPNHVAQHTITGRVHGDGMLYAMAKWPLTSRALGTL